MPTHVVCVCVCVLWSSSNDFSSFSSKMVKLDASLLRYLEKDDFRVLTAVEMGMRNHELVPRSLVFSISGIHNGSIGKILLNLTQNKLLVYERGKRYDGYRLTYRGYDFLALNVFRTRGSLASIGNQIGVGKESDVYIASDDEGRQMAIKFHRLGRTCFRKVTEKRDYQGKNQNHKTASWIYLSRLAAMREYAFMKILNDRQVLPIPAPIDYNRHCIVMQMIDGTLLNQVAGDSLQNNEIETLYEDLMQMIITLANDFGVVHGDFNEFNILIKSDNKPVMIDFPQMIAVDHELAEEYFQRDVNCIIEFFEKRFNYVNDTNPCFETINNTQDDSSNTEMKKLIELMSDETKLIQQIQCDKTEVAQPSCQDESSDLMSKFLSSLPTSHANAPTSEDLYYEQPNDKLLQEAEDKVKLENKMQHLGISSNTEEAAPQLVSQLDDQNDKQSVHSFAYSTASTFSPMEVKSRLLRERKKREIHERNKFNPKNVKGDANAMQRRKKNDQALANEDLHAYRDGSW